MSVKVQSATDPGRTLSKDRCVPGSFDIPIATWPETATATSDDPDTIAAQAINAFNSALDSGDTRAIASLFLEDGYWRDHLANQWDLRTLRGRDEIVAFLAGAHLLTKIEIDRSSAFRSPRYGAIDGQGAVEGVQFFFTVSSKSGTGRGVARLAEQHGQWKIFTFFTALNQILGHEERVGPLRAKGVEHGGKIDRTNWLERRTADLNFENSEPTVLIVGAGQAGLTVAARLKTLGLDTLIIDTEKVVGDNWRRRYHQLVLHDPVWYDHMPYVNFPTTWPIFTPKDKLAEFFEMYVKLLELNVWVETSLESSFWDESKKRWTINLRRTKHDGSVEMRTFHPKHVIQATGHSGKMNFPSVKGMSDFKGDLLCHSSQFKGASAGRKGKKAVIVGSCNSAHDIAQDFYEKGYDVTMVQRSTTCVVSSSALVNIALGGLYHENGPPVEDADVYFHSLPSDVLKATQVKVTELQAEHDKETIKGLEKAGFALDKGPSNAGLLMKYFQRGGGYYIDVGASKLIIDGKVKIKQGQELEEVLENGLKFADGSVLEADEIIFATGYQNMRTQAREIFGDKVADRVGDIWGYDEEGEFRTIWRRTGHPGFWFMGGNLAMCRYYSRVLALQIKALEEGICQY
ncbi:dimethylaniline monooxygenase (N-oxide forming) [Dactylonectria estremocensis]|uniref:Dimethylaniline monooxygenase (N-oxide forming) n=1 Tax=Dactylonectria estremocensis TaxID=1079267 RepID=A0A9P9DS31_9HYPO|nr:dimethylaniline monooxygenase (N-oxide forming) [Dactylonectria estremocensis]